MPSLFEQFAVLTPDLSVDGRELSDDFYAALDRDYAGFAGHVLIAAHSFEKDWPTWEKHPAGDEIVVLLSGSAELVLREDDGDRAVTLVEAGSFVLVPRDTWHTAHIAESAQMLFITPGEGTENVTTPP